MSEAKQDGGAAFPMPWVSQNQGSGESTIWQGQGGMSLRQWYAGMAMQGLLAHYGHQGDRLASISFSVADEMIREGQK